MLCFQQDIVDNFNLDTLNNRFIYNTDQFELTADIGINLLILIFSI